jgi:uncharacterized protein YlxW (UPF0749 family)
MQIRRVLTITVLTGSLVVGGASAAVAAERPAGEGRAARCARLAERVGQVPEIRARIGSRIDQMEQRVADATPAERQAKVAARLEPRIERLRGGDTRIADLAARAQQRCAGTT